jgi:uncharacterized membrane protein YoaK (UPF0700 family)
MVPSNTSPGNTPFQGCVLSVIAGYADTVGYLRFDAFAGLMTGNTVLLGIALARGEFGHALQTAMIILAFLGGVAVAAVLRGRGVPLAALLAVEAIALVAAAFIAVPAASCVLAFGMGLQNAAATQFAGITLNTVFLTGNLQKLVRAMVARLDRPRDAIAAQQDHSVVLAYIYGGYLAGVLLGAGAGTFVQRPLLLAPLLLPISLLRFGEKPGPPDRPPVTGSAPDS